MKSMNRIIAATDLSAPSIHAVDRGFLLAKETGADYTVVHALGLDVLGQFRGLLGEHATDVSQSISNEARDTLTEILAEPARNQGIPAVLQLEDGDAADAILTRAEADQAALIVLGARGSGLFKRLLVGSTASRLLRKSRHPVLLVKQAAQTAYRRVLVAVDFSPASESALRTARAIAPSADLLLLHVFDVPFEGKLRYAGIGDDIIQRYRDEAHAEASRKMHDLAADAGLSRSEYAVQVTRGGTTWEIISQQEKHQCDLIAMCKHGTHVTEELLIGSETRRVLSEVQCDVLVIVDERNPEPVKITP
jgi:nucleotide-binding universal stress UspA family protein